MLKSFLKRNCCLAIRKTLILIWSLMAVALCHSVSGISSDFGEDPMIQKPMASDSLPDSVLIAPKILPDRTDAVAAKKNRLPRYITNGHYILIHKGSHSLNHYQNGHLKKSYPIAIGRGEGDKTSTKVMMTPEGHFQAVRIKNSSLWTYDFKDGKGPVIGAYGPWFISILTDRMGTFSREGWTGIGIHGTHDETTIGTNSSHGCIRMRNSDLEELKSYLEGQIVKTSIPVDILP